MREREDPAGRSCLKSDRLWLISCFVCFFPNFLPLFLPGSDRADSESDNATALGEFTPTPASPLKCGCGLRLHTTAGESHRPLYRTMHYRWWGRIAGQRVEL